MRKLRSISLSISLIVLTSTISLFGQNAPSSKVVFLNASVFFKTGGKSFQQVAASYHSLKNKKIAFFQNGKEMQKADFFKSDNRILLVFQSVTRPDNGVLAVKINHSPKEKCLFALISLPKKCQIYFVQHSLTEIGYTRPQSEILAEDMHNYDNAPDYCDQTDQLPDDANGIAVCMSDYFENAGVKYLDRGISETRSILRFVFPFTLTIPYPHFV